MKLLRPICPEKANGAIGGPYIEPFSRLPDHAKGCSPPDRADNLRIDRGTLAKIAGLPRDPFAIIGGRNLDARDLGAFKALEVKSMRRLLLRQLSLTFAIRLIKLARARVGDDASLRGTMDEGDDKRVHHAQAPRFVACLI